MIRLLKKKYTWSIILAVFLSTATTLSLLEAFVFPQAITPVTGIPPVEDSSNISLPDTEKQVDEKQEIAPVVTENSYKDENISINIEKVHEDGITYYVADVELTSIDYLKTALAKNTFGKNITEKTSVMAKNNDAIFAVTGDYYGHRDRGLIIRNGILYRDNPRSSPDDCALGIDKDGNLVFLTEGQIDGETLVAQGITQSFSFGPALVEDSKIRKSFESKYSASKNPRTAIGQIAPLHYLFIVVDGRSKDSEGITFPELAKLFADRGATIAYNIDGGGSATMWFNGKVVNSPTDGNSAGERSISDIIYIGKDEPQ